MRCPQRTSRFACRYERAQLVPLGRLPAGMAEQHEPQLKQGQKPQYSTPSFWRLFCLVFLPVFSSRNSLPKTPRAARWQPCPQPHVVLLAADSQLSPAACLR